MSLRENPPWGSRPKGGTPGVSHPIRIMIPFKNCKIHALFPGYSLDAHLPIACERICPPARVKCRLQRSEGSYTGLAFSAKALATQRHRRQGLPECEGNFFSLLSLLVLCQGSRLNSKVRFKRRVPPPWAPAPWAGKPARGQALWG